MLRHSWPLLFFVWTALASAQDQGGRPREGAFRVQNLGVPSSIYQPWALDRGVALSVVEFSAGQDLNGNGSTGDTVLLYFDVERGEFRGTPIGGVVTDTSGSTAALEVREVWEGSLNGDADARDRVGGVLLDDGSVRIIPHALVSQPLPLLVGEDWAVFEFDEAADEEDHNGDGVLDDAVLHVYHVPTDTLVNTGFAGVFGMGLGRRGIAFVVEESKHGVDLSGDGVLNDKVGIALDLPTGTITNLGLAVHQFAYHRRWIAFNRDEVAVGVDLNGDGDSTDRRVQHVYDRTTGVATNVGYAIENFHESPIFARTQMLMRVRESEHGQLNLDGDQDDLVAMAYDLVTGQVQNLERTVHEPTTDGSIIAFLASEEDDDLDMNGDGDKDDLVLQVYDPVTRILHDLGLAARTPLAQGDRVLFLVEEAGQGGVDLNGDGDALDWVVHVHDASAGTTTNLGLAGRPPITIPTPVPALLLDGRIVFWASEGSQGGTDLNGDGDTFDLVLFDLEEGSLEPRNLRLAAETAQAQGSMIACIVPESPQDLNGDGDPFDEVPHAVSFVGPRQR